VILEHGDVPLPLDIGEQGALDLAAGDVAGVEYAAL